MSSKVLSRFGENNVGLSCSICARLYHTPRILPCYHSFCQDCLTTIVGEACAKNERCGSFPCPVCREDVAMRDGGALGFQVNAYLVAHVARAMHLPARQPCSVCISKSDDAVSARLAGIATRQCVECDKLMCTDCLQIHNALLPSHTLTTLAKDGPFRVHKVASCSKHPREFLRFHCLTCRTPVCRDCCTTLHAEGHQFRDISDMSEEARAVVSKTTHIVSQTLLPLLVNKSESSFKQLREKEINRKTLELAIKKREEELITLIKEASKEALKTVDDTLKVFEDDYQKTMHVVARLQSQCDYNKMVLQGDCEVDILLAAKDLKTFKTINLDPSTALSDQTIVWNKNDLMYLGDMKSETGYFTLEDWKRFAAGYLGRAGLRKKKKCRSPVETSFRSGINDSLHQIEAALAAADEQF